MNAINKINQSVRIKHRKKEKSQLFAEMLMQSTNQWRDQRFDPGEKLSWRRATVGDPLANSQKKNWEMMVNPDVDCYT